MSESLIDTLYDKDGKAVGLVLENGRIVTADGKCLGFFVEKEVFDYDGNHVGWYDAGILRDLSGNTISFGENVSTHDCPILPTKGFRSDGYFTESEPFRPTTKFPSTRPTDQGSWSEKNIYQIFGK